jgi:hypothetical protein
LHPLRRLDESDRHSATVLEQERDGQGENEDHEHHPQQTKLMTTPRRHRGVGLHEALEPVRDRRVHPRAVPVGTAADEKTGYRQRVTNQVAPAGWAGGRDRLLDARAFQDVGQHLIDVGRPIPLERRVDLLESGALEPHGRGCCKSDTVPERDAKPWTSIVLLPTP